MRPKNPRSPCTSMGTSQRTEGVFLKPSQVSSRAGTKEKRQGGWVPSVSVCLSVSHCLSLSLTVSLCLSLSLSVSLCLPLSLCLSVSLALSLCLCLCVCVRFCCARTCAKQHECYFAQFGDATRCCLRAVSVPSGPSVVAHNVDAACDQRHAKQRCKDYRLWG